MKSPFWINQMRRSPWIIAPTLLAVFALTHQYAHAQSIRDDATLGNERSTVTRDVIRGILSDRIDGGARRGANLFHSFEQFDIPENRGAYFSNPEGIENIFSRVTGGDRSEINGRLGVIQQGSSDVLGTANLFLINPNGIVFGHNSSLDVGGSFAATTADTIQFGDRGSFRASTPESPSPLLTMNPSAFLFSQDRTGEIMNLSNTPAGLDSSGLPVLGLRVADGQDILLLGGNVQMHGGQLNARGGKVEIGAVAGIGAVGFDAIGGLSVPDRLIRADVLLTNHARIDVTGERGGDIIINAQNLRIEQQSRLQAGVIASAIDPEHAVAGNIEINTTQAITLTDAVNSNERSAIANIVGSQATRRGGNIRIATGTLLISDGAELFTRTQGAGNAGDIFVNASDNVTVRGTSINGNLSRLGSQTRNSGNAGNLTIRASNVVIDSGAQVFTDTATNSSGNAGNLSILASDQLYISGASLVGVDPAEGITRLGGHLSRLTSRTQGAGNAGNLTLRARDVVIDGGAQVSASNSNSQSTGNGGILTVNASQLRVSGVAFNAALTDEVFSSRLTTRTLGFGDAGDLKIAAGTILIEGGAQISGGNSSSDSSGNAGTLTITARDQVRVSGMSSVGTQPEDWIASRLTTRTLGSGNAGDLTITARQVVVEDGAEISVERTSTSNSSRIGNVVVNANTFEATGGGSITTTIFSDGQAGNITLRVTDTVTLSGVDSRLIAETASNSSGVGGAIRVITNTLRIVDGASISARSEGTGNAGNINIHAGRYIDMSNGEILTAAEEGSGGVITVESDAIRLRGDSDISSNVTSGPGGGDIRLMSGSILAFDDSDIFASARGGRGGNITLDTPAFFGKNYQPVLSRVDPDTLVNSDKLDSNDRVDIDASGVINGVITLPDVTFIQNSLTDLPETAINPDSLVSSSCIARSGEQAGSFIITGVGGIPVRPGDAAISIYPTGTVRPVPISDAAHNSPTPDRPWQLGDPIIEPQGVYNLSDQRLVVSRQCQ